jgi:hypothetical protein
MAIHKGTELNNVKETWEQNEQARQGENAGVGSIDQPAGVDSDLQQTIKEEAAEYDQANKDERVLDGERATVRDADDNDRNQ